MVWCNEYLSPTNISAGYQHRLGNRTGSEVHLPKRLDKKEQFIYETITLETFINTKLNYSKPQSKMSVPKPFDCYAIEKGFQPAN